MLTPYECANLFDENYRKEHGYQSEWTTLDSDKYDTQFIISKRDDGEVVIVFKQSDSMTDWLNNFHFWKKAYKDAEINFHAHSGFLRCWKEVRHHIEDAVKTLNPQSITVTGWSYGGAMAVLCMEDMGYLFPLIERQCITFGAPRVIGWHNWSKIKDRWKNTRQFKNGSDLVTTIPFLGMGFHHVAELTCIGQRIKFWRYLMVDRYHKIHEYIKTFEEIIR